MAEIFYSSRTYTFDIHPGPGFAQLAFIAVRDEVFLMDRISFLGITSNLFGGIVRVDDRSIGRLILELPLLWWAYRPRRALTVAWVFKPASTLGVSIGFKDHVPPARDLLGRDRVSQRLLFVAEGRNVYQ